MKKSILAAAILLSVAACKKTDNTSMTTNMDSSAVSQTPAGEMVTDSTNSTGNNMANLKESDREFADKAARGGMLEVQAGQLAETNGSNAAVKSFGKQMVDDHTTVNNELKSWASSAGYTLPTTLEADAQKKLDELKGKKGADFDKAYTEFMVSDHKEDISLFKKQADANSNSELSALAKKTLPTLEHHLKMAEEAKAAVK